MGYFLALALLQPGLRAAHGRGLSRAVAEQIDAVAFGHLFLGDVRAYCEKQLEGTGLAPLFPAWQIPTDVLAREMIASGLRARIS